MCSVDIVLYVSSSAVLVMGPRAEKWRRVEVLIGGLGPSSLTSNLGVSVFLIASPILNGKRNDKSKSS